MQVICWVLLLFCFVSIQFFNPIICNGQRIIYLLADRSVNISVVKSAFLTNLRQDATLRCRYATYIQYTKLIRCILCCSFGSGQPSSRKQNASGRKKQNQSKSCYFCGNKFSADHRKKCPARDVEFRLCKKNGQFAKLCNSKRRVNRGVLSVWNLNMIF